METALLVLVVLLQMVLLVLFAGVMKKRSAGEGLAERVEGRIRELEKDLGKKITALGDTGQEELLALVGSVRASVEDLAQSVRSKEGPVEPEPPSPASSPADEVRPLLRELAESLDARLREITDLVARGGSGSEDDALVRALQGKGYERVTCVDRPVRDGSRLVAIIEARRAGMTYKGRVAIDDGEIVEEDLSPMHRMFP